MAMVSLPPRASAPPARGRWRWPRLCSSTITFFLLLLQFLFIFLPCFDVTSFVRVLFIGGGRARRLGLAGQPVDEGSIGEEAVLVLGVAELGQEGHGVLLGDLVSWKERGKRSRKAPAPTVYSNDVHNFTD